MKPPTATERAAQSARDRDALRSRLIGTPAPAPSIPEQMALAREAMNAYRTRLSEYQMKLIEWSDRWAIHDQTFIPDDWFLDDIPPAWEYR